MKKFHFIVAGVVVLAGVLLYIFGKTKSDEKQGTAPMANNQAQAADGHLIPDFDIQAYLKSLGDTLSDKTNAGKAASYATVLADANDLTKVKEAVDFYTKIEKPIAVAFASLKLGQLENTRKSLEDAGDINSILMNTAPDETVRHFLGKNAITCYESASKIEPNNEGLKLKTASAVIDEGSNPMQGITMIREVLARDSNNVDAHMMLGKFSILSGQMDKALQRFEKVLSLQPSNAEAMLGMAQVFETQGNIPETIRYLEMCLNSGIEPEFKQNLRKHIEELKKKNVKQ